ncbi:MAG: nitrilase-related carbon-nitrogen hydrolase [Gammaproteobacteria bacterium]
MENLCYVVAAAQTGTHPGGRRTWGHSMIIDPWGQKLGALEHGAGSTDSKFDPVYLNNIRDNFPALSHRRL